VSQPSPAAEANGRANGRQPLLEVRDLTMHFPIVRGLLMPRQVGAVRAVDGISFELRKGETLGLVGESGCGKSTTGRCILQIQRPTGGRVVFDGRELTGLGEAGMRQVWRKMQMVFQDPYSSLNPRLKVEEIVGEPLEIHRLASSRRARRQRVGELLGLVGLSPAMADRYPHEFSGGQRQRISIARGLAVEPEFIVCDEPVSALDVSIRAQILNLLERLQEELGLTYLFISHDLGVVRHISDRVAVMYLGRIVEIASRASFYERPLHPYSRALLSAVPVPDPEMEARRQRIILTGDVPSPQRPPSGCRFHPRCPWARDLCRQEEPPLFEASDGHRVACHFWSELEGRAPPPVAPVV
jgi:oligopeptide transport system ATP-binding protein